MNVSAYCMSCLDILRSSQHERPPRGQPSFMSFTSPPRRTFLMPTMLGTRVLGCQVPLRWISVKPAVVELPALSRSNTRRLAAQLLGRHRLNCFNHVPQVGFEPTIIRLKVGRTRPGCATGADLHSDSHASARQIAAGPRSHLRLAGDTRTPQSTGSFFLQSRHIGVHNRTDRSRTPFGYDHHSCR